MALSATTEWEVRNGGSDTICSGAFDPGQTAGMFTDLASTNGTSATPIVTSASYNFAAGDVDAYVFVGAGTSWTKGWYKITSVASNAATLSAAASGYRAYGTSVNTSAGCGSAATLTGGTWSIDYSQQAAAEKAYTDLACAGAGLTVSSAAQPFAKQMVGNSIIVTGGDANITAGIYVIASVAAAVATVVGAANISTGAVTTGTGNMGGAHVSIGKPGGFHVGGNTIWVKYHATPYASTSTTSNVTVGRLTMTAGAVGAYTVLMGYDALRGDRTANRPTLQWGVNAASNFLVTGAANASVANVVFDGNRANYTNPGAFTSAGQGFFIDVKIMGTTVASVFGSAIVERLEYTDNTVVITGGSQAYRNCYFHDNTVGAVTISTGQPTFDNCIFDTNAGAGIAVTGAAVSVEVRKCVFYGHSGNNPGINVSSAPAAVFVADCIFEGNTTFGVTMGGAYGGVWLANNAFYNNTSGAYSTTLNRNQNVGEMNLSASPFIDAANGDFRLNNAGAGRTARDGGYAQTLPGLSWQNYPPVGVATSNPNANTGGYFAPW